MFSEREFSSANVVRLCIGLFRSACKQSAFLLESATNCMKVKKVICF